MQTEFAGDVATAEHPSLAADDRLAQLEAFNGEVSAAIASLVDTMLEMKEAAAARPDFSEQVTALQKKVRELETQLHVERTNRDMADVSRMHPKARSAVFVGTIYFGDNVKYAWLACRERAAALGIECWFLPSSAAQQAMVESLGGQCFPASYGDWSADHIHAALSAGVVVTSDHFLNANPYAAALMAGARHVQLWHGVSIKEIGFRNLSPGRNLSPHYAKVLATCGKFSTLVGTSATAEAEWRRWFAFDQYAAIGYPRNDVLHRTATPADLVNVDVKAHEAAREARRQGRRVFMYAPTFRDAQRGTWLLTAGLDAISHAVHESGDLLIVNLHPIEQGHIADLSRVLGEVLFVKPHTDAYPLLRETDALITDYSSVMFDYLQLQRPIILYRPDHEAYVAKSRKLFDDKLEVMPGPMLTEATALVQSLSRADLGQTLEHDEARRQLLASLFAHVDGDSGVRLLRLIDSELSRAPR